MTYPNLGDLGQLFLRATLAVLFPSSAGSAVSPPPRSTHASSGPQLRSQARSSSDGPPGMTVTLGAIVSRILSKTYPGNSDVQL